MPLKQLTDEQIRTLSPARKDRWWLTEVYQGDVPQMTFRVIVVGFILGGLLSCLAMFIGSFVFWLMGQFWPRPEQRMNQVFVQNQESICAGVVAGAALIGVATMAAGVFAEQFGIKLA